jgi:hypothetical protein
MDKPCPHPKEKTNVLRRFAAPALSVSAFDSLIRPKPVAPSKEN